MTHQTGTRATNEISLGTWLTLPVVIFLGGVLTLANLLMAGLVFKSSLSGNNGGQCVEVAVARGRDCGVANKVDEEFVVLVRDSTNPGREPQVFTVAEWDAFLDGVSKREFDSARLIEEFAAPVR